VERLKRMTIKGSNYSCKKPANNRTEYMHQYQSFMVKCAICL
jgi:hypothetical protein